jgi:hypothetical protein
MSCWYAGACMVNYYYEVGPRLGLPGKYARDEGLSEAEVALLARAEGLRFLPAARHPFTPETLMQTLRNDGPVWSAGYYFDRKHVVVLTSCDDQGTLYYNDPAEEVPQQDLIDWYNDSVYPNLLLVKDLSHRRPAAPAGARPGKGSMAPGARR